MAQITNITLNERNFLDGNIATIRGIDLMVYGEIQPAQILEAFEQQSQDDFLIDMCEHVLMGSSDNNIWIQSGEVC